MHTYMYTHIQSLEDAIRGTVEWYLDEENIKYTRHLMQDSSSSSSSSSFDDDDENSRQV